MCETCLKICKIISKILCITKKEVLSFFAMTLYSLIFAVFFIQPSIQNYNELYKLHNKKILDDDIVNANFYALILTSMTYLLFAFYVTYNRFFKIKSKRKIKEKDKWKLIRKIFILSIKQKLLLISKAIDKISSILYGFSSFTLSFIAIKTRCYLLVYFAIMKSIGLIGVRS